MDAPRLMNLREVAAYLSVSVNTVRRMAERGDLPKPLKISPGVVRWDRAAVDKYLDGLSPGVHHGFVDPDKALAEA